MAWYIKKEVFTNKAENMSLPKRQSFVKKHKEWVLELKKSGYKIFSGYLVDIHKVPGGGGLLLLEEKSFKSALSIVKKDPMILAGLVNWKLHEWISISGDLDF